MWEIYKHPLPNWRYRFFPTDTRSLISCVFLGLGMTVGLQIAERIDFAYSGGTLFLVATLVVPQFENPAAMFYGLVGALIVAWINPVVANLTATSPLSFLFFATNALHTVPLTLMVYAFKPKHRGFNFIEFLIINQVAGLLDVLPLIWGAIAVLSTPSAVALGGYLIHQVGFFVASFISYPLMHRLLRSGLVPSAELPESPQAGYPSQPPGAARVP
jgi:hypothetical protein